MQKYIYFLFVYNGADFSEVEFSFSADFPGVSTISIHCPIETCLQSWNMEP